MDTTKFKALLEEQISWPDYYTFKFITKTDSKHQLIRELDDHEITEKPSRNGKYTSVTGRKFLQSADEVIAVYSKISKIEGIITL